MFWGDFMKPVIITALISFGGVILSSFMSWMIARTSAAKELERLKLQWNREDIVTSDEEFSSMASLVAAFAQNMHLRAQVDAISAVASVRTKESGQLAEKLDALYFAVQGEDPRLINDALSQVIQEKRDRRRG